MSQPSPSGHFDETQWTDDQLKRYGPIVGGEALRTFLGFRTYAAFQKARRLGELEVAVFGLRGRQGVFAMTVEACAWLIAQRQAGVAFTDGTRDERDEKVKSGRSCANVLRPSSKHGVTGLVAEKTHAQELGLGANEGVPP
jgi:hypothetical protein